MEGGAGARGGGDVLSQHEPRVGHDDEDEVYAGGPERADDDDAADALGLEHAVSEAGSCRCGRDAGGADGDGILAGFDGHVDVGDVEGGGCEAGGFVNGLAAGTGRLATGCFAVVLGDNQEPGDGEGGRVGGVDERVADVEGGEGEAVEGGLGADVAREQGGHEQRQERVDVH